MPEKLLTINETSRLLGISDQEVKRLVKRGELPAYWVGGRFLRFRKDQIEAIQNEILTKGSMGNPEKTMPKQFKRPPQERAYSESLADRLSDFFYFNDFYVIAATIALLLLWIIFR